MKIGDPAEICEAARIVITGDHPDNGKAYQIKEIRENGWTLTTNYCLFHKDFFELCPLLNSTSAQEWARVSHFQACSLENLSLSDSQKLTNTAQKSYSKDSPTLSITETCEVSQFETSDDNGVSTLSPRQPLVSFLVFRENDLEQPTSETVYPQLSERSASGSAEGSAHLSNPDSFVLKTLQDCSVVPTSPMKPLGHISEISSTSLTSAGMMRNGLLYQADTLTRPLLENGYCWLESPGTLSSG